MALLKCSICGLQKEDGIGSNICPMCGGIFLLEEESNKATQDVNVEAAEEAKEFLHLELLTAKLYQIAQPAFEDENKIENVTDDIKQYLESATRTYPKQIFSFVWNPFSTEVKKIIEIRKQIRQSQAEVALKAATELTDALSGRSVQQDSGMGFSIITNNAVDAATYIGLAAANAKMDRIRNEVETAKRVNQQLRSIPKGTGSSKDFIKEIDLLAYNLFTLRTAYSFVESHRSFYENSSQNDIGVLCDGINIYALLAHAAKSTSGFIGDYTKFKTGRESKQDMQWIVRKLEGAGYVKWLPIDYYVTTGKYENAVLQQQYNEAHPDEQASKNKLTEQRNWEQYNHAEALLSQHKYYDAAVSFARLDGFKDAMQRSMDIWREKILPNDHGDISIGKYARTADGHILLSQNDKYNKRQNQWKQLKGVKQIIPLGQDEFIALDYNGQLTSCVDTKHWQSNPSFLRNNGTRKAVSIFTASDYNYSVAVLHEDGTVSYDKEIDETIASYNLTQWRDICKIQFRDHEVVALKKDGTLLAAGRKLEKFAREFRSWKNIVDFKIGIGCSYLVAETSDGRFLAAGTNPKHLDAVTSWKNVVDVNVDAHIPIAISRNGSLLSGTSQKNTLIDPRLLGLRGVVSICHSRTSNDYLLLRADGTVFTSSKTKDYSDWKNVISIKMEFNYDYAICANGIVLVKEKESKYSPSAREAENWKLFGHVDTLQEEYRKARENCFTSNCDNTKKNTTTKLTKADRKVYLIFILLSVFLLLAGIFALHIGEKIGILFLVGSIGGFGSTIYSLFAKSK